MYAATQYAATQRPGACSNRSFGETLSCWSDEDLLHEYNMTQRREVFETLVRRYERELYNYLRYFLGSADLAEDVFQSTFLQIHLKGHLFEQGRLFRPWLYRIAMNQAIDMRRRNGRLPTISLDTAGEMNDNADSSLATTIPGPEPTPVENALVDERANHVRKALHLLPDALKQVLYLVFFEGMKYHEAAESLGIPFGTVKSRIGAAVKKLNFLLAEEGATY